jgi:hypothetical protein
MRTIFLKIGFCTAILFLAIIPRQNACFAQRAIIQQPVIGRFAVGTTVSVPDRGRALLGGVSRAGESRARFGSFPQGTSIGQFRQNSKADVGVTIHDFQAMDELLLNRNRPLPTGPRLNRLAEDAYQSLQSQSTGNLTRITARRRQTAGFQSARRKNASRGTELGTRNFVRGMEAKKRSAHSLAKIYFQIAAKHGSKLARRELTTTGPHYRRTR